MSRARKRLLLAVKTLLAAVLVAAVGWHFGNILRKQELWAESLTVRAEYLAAAGLLYLAAHALWGTFFVQLLRSQGGQVPWLTGVRAYFVSQFGKYVPGKAWVILLRVVLLRHHGLSRTAVAVTATYETLTSMAAGAVIGVCLLPWLGPMKLGEWEVQAGAWAWAGLGVVAGLPLVLGVLNRVAARAARKARGPGGRPVPSPPVGLLARGLFQDALGWGLLGLSVWAVVQGLSPEPVPLTTDAYLGFLAAAAVSYVAGFVLLIVPGGLGARESVLQAALALQFDPAGGSEAQARAVVVALVVRLVWTAFEVALAGSLWWFARPRAPRPGGAHG